MLARRLTTIWPAMTPAEVFAATRLHSVAGLTGARRALVTTRPFRPPHQTISGVGLIGGGYMLMRGEVSLARHGVRCQDALPECRHVRGHRGRKRANLAKMGSTADHFTVAVRTLVLLAHQLIASPHPCGRGALGGSSGLVLQWHFNITLL
jgi:Magnesium chelatase, subunit ChlI